MDAAASTFSDITLTYESSIHTPYPVHSLHFYLPLPSPHHTPIFTYVTSDPKSPPH